jgi:hypothetical protein
MKGWLRAGCLPTQLRFETHHNDLHDLYHRLAADCVAAAVRGTNPVDFDPSARAFQVISMDYFNPLHNRCTARRWREATRLQSWYGW